jgi:hypothetical protein
MGKTIYVVTSGSYSDYGIDAMFSTEAKANQFIDKYGKSSYDSMGIEEYVLDEVTDLLDKGMVQWSVQMNYDGDVIKVVETNNYGLANATNSFWYGPRRADNPKTNLNMNTYVFAKDKDHAVKIAGERRTRAIALNLWGEATEFNKIMQHEEANQSL